MKYEGSLWGFDRNWPWWARRKLILAAMVPPIRFADGILIVCGFMFSYRKRGNGG